MMMIMPVVLVVMFFAAPAGLNLYWLASNVCSIVQQGVTLKIAAGRAAAPGGRARSAMKDQRLQRAATWKRRWPRPRRALGLPAERLRYVVLEPGTRPAGAGRRAHAGPRSRC